VKLSEDNMFYLLAAVVAGIAIAYYAFDSYQDTLRVQAGCSQVTEGREILWKCPQK